MGTKTVTLREDVYERLQARKRADESVDDLVGRLLEESAPDWREGFGWLPDAEANELEQFVADSRTRVTEGTPDGRDGTLEGSSEELDRDGNELP